MSSNTLLPAMFITAGSELLGGVADGRGDILHGGDVGRILRCRFTIKFMRMFGYVRSMFYVGIWWLIVSFYLFMLFPNSSSNVK